MRDIERDRLVTRYCTVERNGSAPGQACLEKVDASDNESELTPRSDDAYLYRSKGKIYYVYPLFQPKSGRSACSCWPSLDATCKERCRV